MDGMVRLEDGIDNTQFLTRNGRLEICINNAWGTVCNNAFRDVDAQVACHQLIGFTREGKYSLYFIVYWSCDMFFRCWSDKSTHIHFWKTYFS